MMQRLFALLVLAGLPAMPLLAAEPAQKAGNWELVRAGLFGDRAISENDGKVLVLEAPDRAEDAAVVPLSIKTRVTQQPERYIKKVYLVIDRNPSPVGAVFTFTPDSGRADIDTRVRIEEYTTVRAIAEMNDGSLHMASKYVKAAGGCSAPAGKDLEASMARMGKMKFRLDTGLKPDEPSVAQLMVSHPNVSGLAMDQVTRLYAPPQFVRRIDVTYAGKPLMSAEVDFTISEDPNFRFYFVPRAGGELKADVVDSKDLHFTSSVQVTPGALPGS
ncbi:MAG TPA: quinoprotein dehydrogenase-associated SoxYZ-like carrier [Burkholderiales bacterium]|nr:quinoprotein dehydrogenase-associated SoxYZ-like carrier [Burkholderiales bacterium]